MAASAVAQIHARSEALHVTPSVEEPFHLTPNEVIFARWLELVKIVQDVADIRAAGGFGHSTWIDVTVLDLRCSPEYV